MIRLEHANLSVQNTEAMQEFLLTAFPEFRVRGGGTDRTPYGNTTGLNHLGWETDDLAVLEQRNDYAS
jgi:hypothetical protein